jgi:hypothetical protein
MTRPEVAVIWAVGIILLVTGVVMQKLVVRAYGTDKARRAMAFNPFRWRPSWVDGEWFTTSDGLKRFLQAQTLTNLGIIVVDAMAAYVAGRGW